MLTLYLIEKGGALRWLLVPLFALWANLDAWFILGPGLVGLYALGEAFHRLFGGARCVRPGELRA